MVNLGILNRLSYLAKDEELTPTTLTMMIWLLANFCACSTEIKHQVMHSSCFGDCIRRSIESYEAENTKCAAWLCSNSLRTTNGEFLHFGPATELVGYLLELSKNSGDPQTITDSMGGLIFYLAPEHEIDKRVEQLLKFKVLDFIIPYLDSSRDEIVEITLDVLGQLTRYDGYLSESFCDPKLCVKLLKFIKSKNGKPDKISTLAFEILRNYVSSSEKQRRCMIRNDREVFEASMNALLTGEYNLKIAVMEFLMTYFVVETDHIQLLNVFERNIDVSWFDLAGAHHNG